MCPPQTRSSIVLSLHNHNFVGREGLVCIATPYGLDCPGIESRWGRFSAPIQTGPRAHPASSTMGTGSLSGRKRPKLGVDHPPSSSAEVKERAELYLYSPAGPAWPALGWIYSHLSSSCGAHGCADGWGTALQAGRLRVRFPMVSEFFIEINPFGRTMGLGLTQPLTEMSTRNISWG